MKDILSSRGIIEEDTCPLCKRMPETIGHLLKDCIYARDFWYKMNVPPLVVPSLQAIDDVNDWLQVNCLSKLCINLQIVEICFSFCYMGIVEA